MEEYKMTQMKRWLSLLLVLVMLLAVTACTPAQVTETPDTTVSDTETTDPATEPTDDSTEPTPTEPTPTEPTPTERAKPDIQEGTAAAEIPEYNYDTFYKLWDMENEAWMLVYKASNSDGYTAYQTDLEDAGYTLYAENQICDNLYSTWISDDVTVTAFYAPYLKQVRILAEPRGALAPRAEDNVYEDLGVENLLAVVSTNQSDDQRNGMCFVYRLCDGSFYIVDSGHNLKTEADLIYETLCTLAPDPDNIVIAAWLFTHPHSDHVGGFYQFATYYSDKVTLERVIYNFTTEQSFVICENNTNHITKIRTCAAMFGDNVIIHEAHPGEEYYIRDAHIEILTTTDTFTSNVIGYMNDSSIVSIITLGGSKILQMGDCGPSESPILLGMYEDYLNVDIQQVAHHGYQGATKQLNAAISATLAIWPSSQFLYEIKKDQAYNLPLQEREYTIVAATYVTVIPLPLDIDSIYNWNAFHWNDENLIDNRSWMLG